jgi:hypothetical protein
MGEFRSRVFPRDHAYARSTTTRSLRFARAVPLPHSVGEDIYAASFTYSKSPGLLSMPTRGGAIHGANFPGS